jgi:hypothetical protein
LGGTINILNNLFNNNSYGLVSENNGFSNIQGNQFTNNINPVSIISSSFYNINNSVENNTYNGIIVNGYLSSVGTNTIINKDIPIIINISAIIPENSKVTINEGAIIKFKYSSYLDVSGELIANGSSDNMVIFTSFEDDLNDLGANYSSDTNNNGESIGSPNNWKWINIKSGATTTLDHVIVRNGGFKQSSVTKGALWVEGSLTLTNSIIENNLVAGVMLSTGNNSLISNTIFRNNFNEYPSSYGSSGLWIENGVNPELTNLNIYDNYYGLKWVDYIDCTSLGSDSRFIFNNNHQDTICN